MKLTNISKHTFGLVGEDGYPVSLLPGQSREVAEASMSHLQIYVDAKMLRFGDAPPEVVPAEAAVAALTSAPIAGENPVLAAARKARR